MVNLDTSSAIAFISEGSPVRYQLQEYVQGKQMLMTQTACNEFTKVVQQNGGVIEQARAIRFLQRVTIIPDRPSTEALNLQPTRNLGSNDIIIFGTGHHWGIVTMTADAKAVRSINAQGLNLSVYVHAPSRLTGN